jgi:hypothetical protein
VQTCQHGQVAADVDLKSINYSALTDPVDPAEVAAFEAETNAGPARWLPRRGSTGAAPVLIVFALLFIVAPAFVLLDALVTGLAGSWGFLVAAAPLCITVIALSSYILVPSFASPRRSFGWEQHYRLSRFAWENGFTYSPESAKPTYKGALFYNLPAIVYNHIVSNTGRFFDIGNVRYGSPGADNAVTEVSHRGFLAVHIGGALPHIILDAKANDGRTGGIGMQFSDQPTLRLEGNFNEHFTLYCPPGYERDALYILTPDLMALLLDESLAFDVELVGDWMFVYAMKPFDFMDVATYQRLFRIVETVGERAARRSTWYRDDQYSSPEAAAAKPRGSRMKVRIPRWFLVLLLALLASISWIFVSGVLAFVLAI